MKGLMKRLKEMDELLDRQEQYFKRNYLLIDGVDV